MRSLAVSRPFSCCFLILSGPPPWRLSAFLSRNSCIFGFLDFLAHRLFISALDNSCTVLGVFLSITLDVRQYVTFDFIYAFVLPHDLRFCQAQASIHFSLYHRSRLLDLELCVFVDLVPEYLPPACLYSRTKRPESYAPQRRLFAFTFF